MYSNISALCNPRQTSPRPFFCILHSAFFIHGPLPSVPIGAIRVSWERHVRIAEFSVAVTVVDHVGVRFPQSWGLMEAISEACGISV